MKKSIHTREYAYFVERLRKARQVRTNTSAGGEEVQRPQSHVSNVESGQQRVTS